MPGKSPVIAAQDNEALIATHATTMATADCDMRHFTFVTTE
jgi:hypothetical protein